MTAPLRARARLGLASVAEIERDAAGAAANVMAAHEDLLGAITASTVALASRLELVDRECALYEEVVARRRR